jgi:hypothetical protein
MNRARGRRALNGRLPLQRQIKTNAGIIAAALKHHVDLGDRTEFIFDKEGHYFGNGPIAASSKKTYKSHYWQLWEFLSRIGDFESMLMLVSPKLINVPSMKVESLQAFIRYKKRPRGKYACSFMLHYY